MYKYAYLLGSFLFFPLWILIFILRKDLRKQMIFVSFAIAILGTIFEYLMWTVDWWKPETITGTRVGIEIFVLGFTNGGIGAVMYEFIYNKKVRSLKKNSHLSIFYNKHPFWVLLPFVFGVMAIIVSYYYFGLHSFWATLIGTMIAVTLMIINRLDLLTDSIVGGVSLLVVVIPVYILLNNVFPEVIAKFWLINNLSGLLILDIPLEDIIFYFTSGMMVAPAYEYIFRKKVVKKI